MLTAHLRVANGGFKGIVCTAQHDLFQGGVFLKRSSTWRSAFRTGRSYLLLLLLLASQHGGGAVEIEGDKGGNETADSLSLSLFLFFFFSELRCVLHRNRRKYSDPKGKGSGMKKNERKARDEWRLNVARGPPLKLFSPRSSLSLLFGLISQHHWYKRYHKVLLKSRYSFIMCLSIHCIQYRAWCLIFTRQLADSSHDPYFLATSNSSMCSRMLLAASGAAVFWP